MRRKGSTIKLILVFYLYEKMLKIRAMLIFLTYQINYFLSSTDKFVDSVVK